MVDYVSSWEEDVLKDHEVIIHSPRTFKSVKFQNSKKIEIGEFGMLAESQLRLLISSVELRQHAVAPLKAHGKLETSGIEDKKVFNLDEQLIYWVKLVSPKLGDSLVWCSACHRVLPVELTFHMSRGSSKEYCFECKECNQRRATERQQWLREIKESGKFLDDIPVEEFLARSMVEKEAQPYEPQDPGHQDTPVSRSPHSAYVQDLHAEPEPEPELNSDPQPQVQSEEDKSGHCLLCEMSVLSGQVFCQACLTRATASTGDRKRRKQPTEVEKLKRAFIGWTDSAIKPLPKTGVESED